jgi:hypothetical protein
MALASFPIFGSATKSSKERRARQAEERAAKCLGFENGERCAAEISQGFFEMHSGWHLSKTCEEQRRGLN